MVSRTGHLRVGLCATKLRDTGKHSLSRSAETEKRRSGNWRCQQCRTRHEEETAGQIRRESQSGPGSGYQKGAEESCANGDHQWQPDVLKVPFPLFAFKQPTVHKRNADQHKTKIQK